MGDHKLIDGQVVALTPQEQADKEARRIAWEADANNRKIKEQIAALEASTRINRAIREAILDAANMQSINEQIAALRAQLT